MDTLIWRLTAGAVATGLVTMLELTLVLATRIGKSHSDLH